MKTDKPPMRTLQAQVLTYLLTIPRGKVVT